MGRKVKSPAQRRKISVGTKRMLVLQIATEEITFLMEQMARLHEERGPGRVSMENAVFILSDRLKDDPDRVVCIMERMRCLMRLVDDDRMKGWTLECIGKEYVLTHAAVFRATAKCPLRANATQVWFDPDEFFSLALSETEPAGLA